MVDSTSQGILCQMNRFIRIFSNQFGELIFFFAGIRMTTAPLAQNVSTNSWNANRRPVIANSSSTKKRISRHPSLLLNAVQYHMKSAELIIGCRLTISVGFHTIFFFFFVYNVSTGIFLAIFFHSKSLWDICTRFAPKFLILLYNNQFSTLSVIFTAQN